MTEADAMQAFSRFRLYHWLVALLFAAAYLTGEDAGLAHVWLGYGLLALLALRLSLALLGRARGFPRLWPQSPRLSGRIGRWVTLGVLSGSLLTLGLGMSMVDNRAALSEGLAMLMPAARADDGGGDDDHHAMRWGDWLGRALRDVEEAHEALSQGALALVAGHIGWVWLTQRRQAVAMLRGVQANQAGAKRS
ncbi:cytochrome b/b6 domain-containing protein [Rivihabitans pingtungensis]|nr:cytochrome b/b6 domain-containing protein [Rivihabitans pingtungensis]